MGEESWWRGETVFSGWPNHRRGHVTNHGYDSSILLACIGTKAQFVQVCDQNSDALQRSKYPLVALENAQTTQKK